MYDPRRPTGYDQLPMGLGGAVSAILPQGIVGVLGGAFLLLLLAILTDWVTGIWQVAAIAGLVVLVPLIGLAIKREMRRDTEAQRVPRQMRLPDDAELSDDERRAAMRRSDDDEHRT